MAQFDHNFGLNYLVDDTDKKMLRTLSVVSEEVSSNSKKVPLVTPSLIESCHKCDQIYWTLGKLPSATINLAKSHILRQFL